MLLWGKEFRVANLCQLIHSWGSKNLVRLLDISRISSRNYPFVVSPFDFAFKVDKTGGPGVRGLTHSQNRLRGFLN